jgi:hypothetical protein
MLRLWKVSGNYYSICSWCYPRDHKMGARSAWSSVHKRRETLDGNCFCALINVCLLPPVESAQNNGFLSQFSEQTYTAPVKTHNCLLICWWTNFQASSFIAYGKSRRWNLGGVWCCAQHNLYFFFIALDQSMLTVVASHSMYNCRVGGASAWTTLFFEVRHQVWADS